MISGIPDFGVQGAGANQMHRGHESAKVADENAQPSAGTLLSALVSANPSQAALAATQLATLLTPNADDRTQHSTSPEVEAKSVDFQGLAQALLTEYRAVLQGFLRSDQAALTMSALRLLAAVARFGSGYARETFLTVQPNRDLLVQLLQKQRQRQQRKRRRLSELEKRTTTLEKSLLQWLDASALASNTFAPDLRELYAVLLRQVLQRIRFRQGANDIGRLLRVLRTATWLNSGRMLGSLLSIVEFVRGEQHRAGLIKIIAQTRDQRSLAQYLARENLSSSVKLRLAQSMLQAGGPEMSLAFLKALTSESALQDTNQSQSIWKSEQVALAIAALRQCTCTAAFSLPQNMRLDFVTCNAWIAALENGGKTIPSLTVLIDYIRQEAMRASNTLGSLRLARGLRLLRLCIEKRPEQIFQSGLDLTKIIPKAPETITYACSFTGAELVRTLGAMFSQNRSIRLATRLQDLFELRALPRAPLYAFFLQYLNEYGLLRNPHSGETCSLEASLWLDLLRFAAPSTRALFERIITEATCKPYAILDDALHSQAPGETSFQLSPLWIAVERRVRSTSDPYLEYCLKHIKACMAIMRSGSETTSPPPAPAEASPVSVENAMVVPRAGQQVLQVLAPDARHLDALYDSGIGDARDFIQSGALRSVLFMLAVEQNEIRHKAYDILATFYRLVPVAVELRERRLVQAVLDVLRSSITQPYQRLPRIQCALFASLAEIVTNGNHDLFKFAWKVTLLRPCWSLMEELPGVHEMIYSPEERVHEFLLQLLLEGNDTSDPFYAILRRHRLYSYLVGRKTFALRFRDRLQPLVDQVLHQLLAFPEARKRLERTCALETWLRLSRT